MTTLMQRDVIALTIFGEARGEPIEGKIAVASVIQNRYRTGKWGKSYEAVCLAAKQFSCWNSSDPNAALLKSWTDKIQRGEPIADVTLRECYWIADGILSQALQSNVGKSTHYFASSLPKAPAWARTGELVETIAHHHFFENVA